MAPPFSWVFFVQADGLWDLPLAFLLVRSGRRLSGAVSVLYRSPSILSGQVCNQRCPLSQGELLGAHALINPCGRERRNDFLFSRSEERRVGKECRSRW